MGYAETEEDAFAFDCTVQNYRLKQIISFFYALKLNASKYLIFVIDQISWIIRKFKAGSFLVTLFNEAFLG